MGEHFPVSEGSNGSWTGTMKQGRSCQQIAARWIQKSAHLTSVLAQVQKSSKVLASNGVMHIPTHGERIPVYTQERKGKDLALIKRYAPKLRKSTRATHHSVIKSVTGYG